MEDHIHVFELRWKIWQYEDMIDHRSFSSCEIKAWKNFGLNGIRTLEPTNPAIPVQRCTNGATKPLGAGKSLQQIDGERTFFLMELNEVNQIKF